MSKFASIAGEIIYSALNLGLSHNVYGDVPDQIPGLPEDKFPFVAIGNDQQFPFDTDDCLGEKITVEIRIYSAKSGLKEVKDIQGEIYDILHRAEITYTGVNVVDCLHVYSNAPSTSANNYRQGISRYRLTLMEG